MKIRRSRKANRRIDQPGQLPSSPPDNEMNMIDTDLGLEPLMGSEIDLVSLRCRSDRIISRKGNQATTVAKPLDEISLEESPSQR